MIRQRSSWQYSVFPRTSIWKAIQRLEKDGVVIDPSKKGYKLSQAILLPEVIASNTQLTASKRTMKHPIGRQIGIEAQGPTWPIRSPLERPRSYYYCPDQGASTCPFISSLTPPPAELLSIPLMVAGAIYKAIKDLTLIDIGYQVGQ